MPHAGMTDAVWQEFAHSTREFQKKYQKTQKIIRRVTDDIENLWVSGDDDGGADDDVEVGDAHLDGVVDADNVQVLPNGGDVQDLVAHLV